MKIASAHGQQIADLGEPPSPAADSRRMGRYVVLQRIGAGAMGEVFLAYDPQLGRKVALKCVSVERLASEYELDIDHERERVLQEARLLANLSHPGVVAVYDVGIVGSIVFIAMEYLEGENVRGWLKQSSRSQSEILQVLCKLARALEYVHQHGMVHRDIKPDNVMCTADGRVVLLDFGLAETQKMVARPRLRVAAKKSNDVELSVSLPAITVSSRIEGTPAYMAPEQHLGTIVDAKADIFAYCVMGYELLANVRPFPNVSAETRLDLIATRRYIAPRKGRTMPSRLMRKLEQGLEYEPGARPTSIAEVVEAIGWHQRRRARVFSQIRAGLLAIVVAVVVFTILSPEPAREDRLRERFETVFDGHRLATQKAQFERNFPQIYAESGGRIFGMFVRAEAELREQLTSRLPSAGTSDALELCLSRRVSEFDSLFSLLDGADKAVARESLGAVQILVGQTDCTRNREMSLLPEDPHKRRIVTGLYDQLSRVHVQSRAGRFEDSLDDLAEICDASAATGFLQLSAACEYERSYALRWMFSQRAATTALERAGLLGVAARGDQIAADASAELVYVVGYLAGQGHGQEAADLLVEAAARVDRADDHGAARAELERAYGIREAGAGNVAGLMRHLSEAYRYQRQDTRFDPVMLVERLNDKGYASYASGDQESGMELLLSARELGRDTLGVAHVGNILPLVNLAIIEEIHGQVAKALHYIDEIELNVDLEDSNARGLAPCVVRLQTLAGHAWDDEVNVEIARCARRFQAVERGDFISRLMISAQSHVTSVRVGKPISSSLVHLLATSEELAQIALDTHDIDTHQIVFPALVAAQDTAAVESVLEDARALWPPLIYQYRKAEFELERGRPLAALNATAALSKQTIGYRDIGDALLGDIALFEARAYLALAQPQRALASSQQAVIYYETDANYTGRSRVDALLVGADASAQLQDMRTAKLQLEQAHALASGHILTLAQRESIERLRTRLGLPEFLQQTFSAQLVVGEMPPEPIAK